MGTMILQPLGSIVEVGELETLAKGVVIVGDGVGPPTTFGPGADGLAVVFDSATATGLNAAAPAPGAHVHAASDTTSGTFADARISLSSVTQHANVKTEYRDEGVALGTTGTVSAVDYVGPGVTATRVGDVVTVTISGGAAAGANSDITSMSGLTGGIATPTQIDFSVLGAAPAHLEGRVFYLASDDHTLCYYNDEADITHNIGQEFWTRVRNTTGSTILDGQAVYINGAVGPLPTIALAVASSFATCSAIGLATHDIENNTNGYVTKLGIVRGLNTSAFADGDVLYLSAATPGAMTTTPPAAPNCVARVGIVARSHVSQGRILVDVDHDTVSLSDTDGSHRLVFAAGSNLTANRTLTFTTGDADRTLTLTGNATLNQDVSTTATPTFAGVTLGTVTLDDVTNGIHVHGANAGGDVKLQIHNSTTTDSSSSSLTFGITTAADSDTGRIRYTRGVGTADTTMTMAVRSSGVLTTALTIAPSLAATFAGSVTTGTLTLSGSTLSGTGDIVINPTGTLYVGDATGGPFDAVRASKISLNGGLTNGVTFNDSDSSHVIRVTTTENVVGDSTLDLHLGSSATRVLTLNGNPTLDDWFDQSVKTTSSPTVSTFNLDAGAVTQTDIDLLAGGVLRTRILKTPGGNFGIESYNATGVLIDQPIAWLNVAGARLEIGRDAILSSGRTLLFVAPSSNCPIRLLNAAQTTSLAVCYPSLATNTADRNLHIVTPDADMTVTHAGSITFSAFAATLTDDADAAAARTTLVAQVATQYQDEGVNIGTSGAVTVVNFVGAGVSAAVVGTTATVTIAGGAGTPAGADTEVQFNNAGAFGASASFTFNSGTNTLKSDFFEDNSGSMRLEGGGVNASLQSLIGNLSLGAATSTIEFNNSSLINIVGITTTGNTLLGNAAADTFKVHGASAQSGAQAALVADATDLATNNTLTNALKVMAINHGLMAAV